MYTIKCYRKNDYYYCCHWEVQVALCVPIVRFWKKSLNFPDGTQILVPKSASRKVLVFSHFLLSFHNCHFCLFVSWHLTQWEATALWVLGPLPPPWGNLAAEVSSKAEATKGLNHCRTRIGSSPNWGDVGNTGLQAASLINEVSLGINQNPGNF